MKTWLITLLLFLSLNAQAQNPWGQTYTPFPTDSMLGWWVESWAGQCSGIVDPVYYRMWKDTLVEGQPYFQVLRKKFPDTVYKPFYLFRQDTAAKKAWFRVIGRPVTEPDTLLFDFSLAANSVVPPGCLRNKQPLEIYYYSFGRNDIAIQATSRGHYIEGQGSANGVFLGADEMFDIVGQNPLAAPLVKCLYSKVLLEGLPSPCQCPNLAALIATTKPAAASSISLYPNPATNILHIDSPHSGLHRVVFYDAQGREACNIRRTDVMSWDVSRLAPGRYMVQVSSPAGQGMSSFVKE